MSETETRLLANPSILIEDDFVTEVISRLVGISGGKTARGGQTKPACNKARGSKIEKLCALALANLAVKEKYPELQSVVFRESDRRKIAKETARATECSEALSPTSATTLA